MQQAYYVLFEEEADDYPTLKNKILSCCELSSTRATAEFHHWAYQSSKESRGQMDASCMSHKDGSSQIRCPWWK